MQVTGKSYSRHKELPEYLDTSKPKAWYCEDNYAV